MKSFIMLSAIFFSGLVAKAQATATFTASATIIQPIEITTLTNLNFDEIEPGTGGEIILTPKGERIVIGNASLGKGFGVTAATFQVKGQDNLSYSVTLPSGHFLLTSGEKHLTIKDFTSNIGSEETFASHNSVFKVGATLVIEANQTPGFYYTTSPITVTVNYN